ncbi:hypothetical protein CQW23_23400 [Capsicum baccatum]|uniref:Uncharacterized protein n=1 Tax=Capsicum baccatum TaxID=33114 RepID=A0A2G2VRV0_CAPBA|nr:hypothetical protein CQW23_23400 [Capsicum baccatum]
MLTSVDSIPLQYVDTIDLRSNLLQGSLPIPPNSTTYFFISENNLSEEIAWSICNLTSLGILDLGRREIPQCLGNITALEVLDMRHNNLSGNITTTFISGSSLRSLNLQVLDLGDNHLIDTFPCAILPKLRIIDLSCNAFLGNLPTSLFQHLKAMRTIDPSIEAPSYYEARYYQDSVTVATKRLEREIVRILYLYTVIDLSSNKFGGQIPSIMGNFIALHILNLSHNGLRGHIPPSFGDLSSIESLMLYGITEEGTIDVARMVMLGMYHFQRLTILILPHRQWHIFLIELDAISGV